MPMQPSPIAETSRSLFPSLRFCIRFLLSRPILLVADLLHPFDRLAVERLLDGDMGHGGGRRGAVPVLLARREDDDVAGANLLDRAALALRPAAARR